MAMTEKRYWGLSAHGFHQIAYFEWGDPNNQRVLICVHGLARRGRDFDRLAHALEADYRVVCPDLPGRGNSQWLPVAADYQPATYLQNLVALIARLDVEVVDWVGTSLGGLLGMMLAAQPHTRIRRLVVNDIGGYIGLPALERIASYVGADPEFADVAAVEAYLRQIYAPFGALSDDHWRHLAEVSFRRVENGKLRMHYDPALAEPFKQGFSEPVTLWPVWDAVRCPVLILRGAQSDILWKETADEMLTRGPQAKLVEFPGIGHAPMLMDEGQMRIVRAWLAD
jgi:pimeloyl-ACP methyl ester carboxylesterase